IVGGFRRSQAAQIAFTEFGFWIFTFGELLLVGVSDGRCHTGAGAGENSNEETHKPAAYGRPPSKCKLLQVEELTVALGYFNICSAKQIFQHLQHLGHSEQPDHNYDEVNAVRKIGQVKSVAVHARVGVNTDRSNEKPQHCSKDAFHGLITQQTGQCTEGEDHQHEVFGGPERDGEVGKQGGKQNDPTNGDSGTDERRPGRERQGHTGQPLACQGIAVQCGHDRGGFTRNVDQNGRDTTAVLGTDIDGG